MVVVNNLETAYRKIFVGGLAWETERDALEKHFSKFGDIIEAVVITDRSTAKSKGYGFVTFKHPHSAIRACRNSSPIIDGRRTNCNLAFLAPPPSSLPTTTDRVKLTPSSAIAPANTYQTLQQHAYPISSSSCGGYPYYNPEICVQNQQYSSISMYGGGEYYPYYYTTVAAAAASPAAFYPFYYHYPIYLQNQFAHLPHSRAFFQPISPENRYINPNDIRYNKKSSNYLKTEIKSPLE